MMKGLNIINGINFLLIKVFNNLFLKQPADNSLVMFLFFLWVRQFRHSNLFIGAKLAQYTGQLNLVIYRPSKLLPGILWVFPSMMCSRFSINSSNKNWISTSVHLLSFHIVHFFQFDLNALQNLSLKLEHVKNKLSLAWSLARLLSSACSFSLRTSSLSFNSSIWFCISI